MKNSTTDACIRYLYLSPPEKFLRSEFQTYAEGLFTDFVFYFEAFSLYEEQVECKRKTGMRLHLSCSHVLEGRT